MGSSSGGSAKAPSMPQPKGSTTTPYGNSTPFSPQYVNFLPDAVAADGRMPMATGLNEDHLASIRGRSDPLLEAQKAQAMAGPAGSAGPGAALGDRAQFAQMMQQYEENQFMKNYLNKALVAMNPGGPRGRRARNGGGDSGGYSGGSSGGGGGMGSW